MESLVESARENYEKIAEVRINFRDTPDIFDGSRRDISLKSLSEYGGSFRIVIISDLFFVPTTKDS